MDDPLRSIAEQIISSRPNVSPPVREQMIEDIITSLEQFINKTLVSKLDEQSSQEFMTYLESDPSGDDIVAWIRDKGVDIESSVAEAVLAFRQTYGAV